MQTTTRELPVIFRKYNFKLQPWQLPKRRTWQLPKWRKHPNKTLFSNDLKFHIQVQEKSNWCWAAVSQAVSRYILKYKKYEQVTIASKMTGCSCITTCLENYPCNKMQLLDKTFRVTGCKYNSIYSCGKIMPAWVLPKIIGRIDMHRPIPCRIQWVTERTGHFSVIYGYYLENVNWIFVADPDSGYSVCNLDEYYSGSSSILTNIVILAV
ncbi:papain-like cysteine protease family protein [Hymenobacter perfusus]|uniref:Peptidase C39-like domain-containing protein n=1 Tax=Hymenobacter perfusus TaxID=1236770 RepID=A0A3R9MRJ6_9BACT|nr:hypothetical protein EI293_20855 [Hymenobacter perfusus]